MAKNNLHKYVVVCHTSGCENDNLPIEIESEDTPPIVVCGACGIEVTDITDIS